MRPLNLIFILMVSITIHGVFLLGFSKINNEDTSNHRTIPQNVKVQIHAIKPTITSAKTRRASKDIIKKAARENTRPSNQKKSLYAQLLPSFEAMAISGKSESRQSTSNSGVLQMDAGSHNHLKVFAEEFSARTDVPCDIFKIQKTGSAKVRVHRDSGGRWRADIEDGDAYSRAILESTFRSIPSNSVGIANLGKISFDQVDIEFIFLARPSNSLEKPPRTLEVIGNKVLLAVYHYEDGKGWDIAKKSIAAVGNTAIGINFFGLGLLAYDSLSTKQDPAQSAGLIRLRNSPAFTKQVLSIPLK